MANNVPAGTHTIGFGWDTSGTVNWSGGGSSQTSVVAIGG
jgi:hypothetical protein